MTEEAWPYAHADLDPSTSNGVKCGADENGDLILWAYPTPDIAGYTYATKSDADGIGSGVWNNLGSGFTARAGADFFNNADTFTAPIDGMYHYTLSFVPTSATAFDIYCRMVSNYSAWGNPYNQQKGASTTFLGGGSTLAGTLPAQQGGTLKFAIYHNNSPKTDFEDIQVSWRWVSPIPS